MTICLFKGTIINKMDLEKEIILIKDRNAKVEAEKAWETSLTRTVLVATITYISILILMLVTGTPKPYLSGLVPMIGFVLSLQTIPIVKKGWLKNKLD